MNSKTYRLVFAKLKENILITGLILQILSYNACSLKKNFIKIMVLLLGINIVIITIFVGYLRFL